MKKIIIATTFLITIFIVFFFLTEKRELSSSFYYWKNSYNLKENSEKTYIKVLDMFYSNKLEYINTRFTTQKPKDFIPVIYISNDAMKNISNEELLKPISKTLSKYKFEEFQLDCDWSLESKHKYFELLNILKKQINKKLSVTIRLHQIKYYYKTGVPKVDYGVLMYYNMSDVANFDTKNSILDNSIAKKYHYNFDVYPLKLKLALPLYSQAIQFRNKRALEIFEGVKKKDFDLEYFKKISQNKYQVIKSTYFKGKYIYKGDIFRFEDSTYEDLKIALNDFFNLSKNSFNEVIFYTINYKNRYNLKKLLKGI